MKSHVQIPKSILRNYSYRLPNVGEVVDYLDLKEIQIKSKKINELDTIENYYSESFDKHMGKKFETPFGDISKKIRDFAKGKSTNLSFSEKETRIITTFFNNIFLRGKYALKKVNEESITSIISPIKQEELLISTRSNLFNHYWVNIIRNTTNTGFVIPRNCFYVKKAKSPNELQYIFPITPKVAIILIPKDEAIEYETSKGTRDHFYIDNEESIKVLNEFALEIEKGTNNEFVVGDRAELDRLKKLL